MRNSNRKEEEEKKKKDRRMLKRRPATDLLQVSCSDVRCQSKVSFVSPIKVTFISGGSSPGQLALRRVPLLFSLKTADQQLCTPLATSTWQWQPTISLFCSPPSLDDKSRSKLPVFPHFQSVGFFFPCRKLLSIRSMRFQSYNRHSCLGTQFVKSC